MFRGTFVGRSRELEVLDNQWESKKATLIILYGRRRVGKTRLLTHWLRSHEEEGMYWVAEPASALTQLRSFSQALMSFMDPEGPVPADFTFSSWELALRQVSLFAQEKRFALFIDEVAYLIDVNPDFVGILQKAWDHWLSNSNLMLALSGSQMGLMQRHLLDYSAPLHGRISSQMQLPPLPYGATIEYFPQFSAAERVMVYAMWGGVPAYWERMDGDKNVLENLRLNLLPAHAWTVDESRILLQDFITDLHNYVGILRAIAEGQQSLGEIAGRIGLSSSKASFYLSVLRDTNFVARKVPVSQRGTDSRRGRYFVTDPYLRFFYRFMAAYQSKLALGQLDQMMALIKEEMPAFINANTWKELCREWVLRASDKGRLPVNVEDVGSEWTRNNDIDVVGLSPGGQNLVLGDCFWGDAPQGPEVLEELVRKTSTMSPWTGDSPRVIFTLFASQGWTDAAREKAKRLLAAQKRSRRKWELAEIRLLDLAQVDADLCRWSI